MTLEPLINAPLPVQVHVAAALVAAALGPVALWRRRRDGWHRMTGYAWVLSMAVAAGSTLLIASPFAVLGPFGPIHALSVAVFWSLAAGLRHARAGRHGAHAAEFRGLYRNALGIAALFTLLPGRRINLALFGDRPEWGLWVIAAVGTLWLLHVGLPRRRRA